MRLTGPDVVVGGTPCAGAWNRSLEIPWVTASGPMSEPRPQAQQQGDGPLPRSAGLPCRARLRGRRRGMGRCFRTCLGRRGPSHAAPPFQIWQGIDIETKMHVRFLNMETMALCH